MTFALAISRAPIQTSDLCFSWSEMNIWILAETKSCFDRWCAILFMSVSVASVWTNVVLIGYLLSGTGVWVLTGCFHMLMKLWGIVLVDTYPKLTCCCLTHDGVEINTPFCCASELLSYKCSYWMYVLLLSKIVQHIVTSFILMISKAPKCCIYMCHRLISLFYKRHKRNWWKTTEKKK